MTPNTAQQLAILLFFVLPGVVYQAVRDALRGPAASEQETGNRFLRAVAVSAVLDAGYLLLFGPALVRLVSGPRRQGLSGLADQPRLAGLVGFVLLVGIPAAVAATGTLLLRRRRAARYDPTPSAWDHLFSNRGGCFVRVKLKDGCWAGGWYGRGAYASAFPQPRDLFLSAQYAMLPDGRFGARLPDTGGIYIPAADITTLEIFNRPDATG